MKLYTAALILPAKIILQKSLVVLQFALASFLIIATFTIYAQFNFLTTEKLGYDDSNLVIVNKWNIKQHEAKLFKNELIKNPNIIGVTAKNGGQCGEQLQRSANDSTINLLMKRLMNLICLY